MPVPALEYSSIPAVDWLINIYISSHFTEFISKAVKPK